MGGPNKSHDSTRAERKAKKRKLEELVPDLPGDEGLDGELENGTEDTKESLRKKKKTTDGKHGVIKEGEQSGRKNEKKRKQITGGHGEGGAKVGMTGGNRENPNSVSESNENKSHQRAELEPNTAQPATEFEENSQDQEPTRKSKKERKAERRAKEAKVQDSQVLDSPAKSNHEDNLDVAALTERKPHRKNNRNREKKREAAAAKEKSSTNSELQNGEGDRPNRFIVFIGNLPFSATTESVQTHLSSVKPISVRHLTQKENPTRSKGCAFVEFEGYDHMKTCLKLFHHSMFDDGISAPRKINVELTAGGGGNTKDRQTKIRDKNQKLNEERIRRMQEGEKAKLTKNGAGTGNDNSIHPSRRSFVPGV